MLILGPTDVVGAEVAGAVVAIGNFDGLHRGHQELIAIAEGEARRLGKRFGLLTFEPHPRTFFKPQEPLFRLTPAPLKQRLVQALGVDFLAWLNFDAELSSMTPEEFVLEHLVRRLEVAHIVSGYDFHFGKGRKGSPQTLKDMGAEHRFGVTIVEQVTDDGDGHAPFASTGIRDELRNGHVESAARELGYDWIVMGEVVHGDKRGRAIGFPTANIILEPGAEPFRGIYAVEVRDAAAPVGTPAWMGAGYFGDRPTFNTERTFLEVYLLDQDLDLYGRTLIVSFVALIRGDKTFKSVGELVAQMKDDCGKARAILTASSRDVAPFPLAAKQRKGLL
jgi:riboflavin kinase / FMN adenylyltransferase